ncbi:MAG TPA: polysaccharide pyruvyl transferase family protein [Verrucomicrobiales bacterium]|nr:polysaccharide pyruvyl transferase family protein [Verrucomicrobiales bacterium]
MKICIMGTPVSSGNRGVLALGASLVNLCWEASGGGEIVLLLGNRDNQPARFRAGGEPRLISVVNSRMSLRSRWRDHFLWILVMAVLYRLVFFKKLRAGIARSTPWIGAIAESEFVGDIRGGDSFSDIYGLKGYILGSLAVWTVILVKGSVVLFPQTYGPYKSRTSKWIAKYILKRASVIIARDLQSQAVAQQLVGKAKKVLLCPDVAFSMESIRPETVEVDPPLAGEMPPGVIGMNINGLMYNGGHTRNNMFGLKMDYASFLRELVIALLAEHQGELWLVPHTFGPDGSVESDQEASRRLRDSLPEALQSRIRLVCREYDQHEIKGVIGMFDFFIGARMHSCIAALSQGIPCIGIAYSRKFAGVFESVGMKDWVVDGRESDSATAIERILALYKERDSVRHPLAGRAADAKKRLETVFEELVNPSVKLSDPVGTPVGLPQT